MSMAQHRQRCGSCGVFIEEGEEIRRDDGGGWVHNYCETADPVPGTGAERPEWCGECDRRTRLIDYGDHMKRCPRCWAWPARATHHKQELLQHKRCGGCGRRVYSWDAMPCGKHQNLAHTGLFGISDSY